MSHEYCLQTGLITFQVYFSAASFLINAQLILIVSYICIDTSSDFKFSEQEFVLTAVKYYPFKAEVQIFHLIV